MVTFKIYLFIIMVTVFKKRVSCMFSMRQKPLRKVKGMYNKKNTFFMRLITVSSNNHLLMSTGQQKIFFTEYIVHSLTMHG